jgi:hypothetical protein
MSVPERRFEAIKDWSPGYINVTPAHIEIMGECTACGAQKEISKEAPAAKLASCPGERCREAPQVLLVRSEGRKTEIWKLPCRRMRK